MMFLSLSRKWADDEAVINAMLEHYVAHRQSKALAVLIFPEGSDLSPSNVAKSQAHARANGLPEFSQVLVPRTTGFVVQQLAVPDHSHPAGTHHVLSSARLVHIIDRMRLDMDAVYDVTIAYRGAIPYPGNILASQMPSSVHMHINRIAISDIPAAADVAAWTLAQFAEKDVLLKKFYLEQQDLGHNNTATSTFACRDTPSMCVPL